MRKICILLFLNVFLVSSLWAMPSDRRVPLDFLVKGGQEMDALCFDKSTEHSSTVYIPTCGLAFKPDYKFVSYNQTLIHEGWIGYDYALKKAPADGFNPTYSRYYQAFEGSQGIHIVYYLQSGGGGSGDFTSLLAVERHGKQLRLKTLAEGDRCFGGIKEVSQKDQTLTYKTQLTPTAFVNLLHSVNVKGLADCAVCCAATATYERSGKNHFEHPVLKTVQLNKDADLSEKTGLQGCFNTLFASQLKKNARLTPRDVQQFNQHFEHRCEKKPLVQ